jgi:hypothetical protein
LMIEREHRLRVRGGMERVYRLCLLQLGGLGMGFRVEHEGIGGNQVSVVLLDNVSCSCRRDARSLPVN